MGCIGCKATLQQASAPDGHNCPQQLTEALHGFEIGAAAIACDSAQPRRERRDEILEQRVEQMRLLLILVQLRQMPLLSLSRELNQASTLQYALR